MILKIVATFMSNMTSRTKERSKKQSTKQELVLSPQAPTTFSQPPSGETSPISSISSVASETSNNSPNRQGPTSSDYQKLEHREQIYLRPDTYLGNDAQIPLERWLFDLTQMKMRRATMMLPDAVERLFLEVLANAGDNVYRSRDEYKVDAGQIEILMDTTTISVKNGGSPIPVELHPTHQIYTPELIFGHLLTSSNYNDSKRRTLIGKNGYGAKLTNIFSKQFMLIVCDGNRKLRYQQVWNENMTIRGEPDITPYQGESSVQVVYTLDFARFGYTEYPEEAFFLFAKHAADVCFTCKVPVSFNGMTFQVQDVKDYAALYFGNERNSIAYYDWPAGTETTNKKGGIVMAKDPTVIPDLEICVVDTPDAGEVLSYVNGLTTPEGGAHVEAVMKALSTAILEAINGTSKKKKKDDKKDDKKEIKLTMSDVRPHLSIIMGCRIDQPKFNSQAKTKLLSPAPKVSIPDKILQSMVKWDLIMRLYSALEAKMFKQLAKTDGKKRRHITLKKGEDANLAGGARSKDCILYVVEGGSAMGYAQNMIDLAANGPDYIGLFPMKGKPLNVMNATAEDIIENEEIKELKKMLGLQGNLDYRLEENFNTLRYGHFMIMADSDVDGKHIIGLVLNLFHCHYPSLLARNYVMYLRTPTLRVYKGKQVHKFYNQREYDAWKAATPDYKSWTHKYYKGLGTSSDEDVADDFKSPRVVVCLYDDQAPDSFRLAFDEKLADERKKWLAQWKPVFEVEDMQMQPISAFIQHEMIQFSLEDLHRSLPRLLDGLKLVQRKVIWAMLLKWSSQGKPEKGLKRSLKEMKLVQFAAFVMDQCNYHHGDKSMSDTIIGMIQDFVGMNNLPYFTKKGQFGTRKHGGSDAAASRYPNTYPEWWIPYVFRREDMPLLKPVVEDGKPVEPETFLPVIPLTLVNGADGIGTGHSTFIPNHNPMDLVQWLRARISGQPLPEVLPWYRGFKGTVSLVNRARAPRANASVPSTPSSVALPEIGDETEEDRLDDLAVQTDAVTSTEPVTQPVSGVTPVAPAVPAVPQPPAVRLAIVREPVQVAPRLSMITQGLFEINGNKVIVTELPIGRWTHKYRKWLDDLIEAKLITDYRSISTTKEVRFEITGFKNPTTQTLKLQRSKGLTNMVLLSQDNHPIKYDTVGTILESFYNERMPYYEARRQYIIQQVTTTIEKLEAKMRYIQLKISGQLVTLNRKKADIIPELQRLGLPVELLTTTRDSNMTQDEIKSLQDEISKLQSQRQRHQQTSAADLWLADLDDFEHAYCRQYNCPLPGGRQLRTTDRSVVAEEEEEEKTETD
jgi:DNA topoisomerase-2